MFLFIKKKLNNLLFFLKLTDIKIIKSNSHNNDIKVTFKLNLNCYRKETSTIYGKELLKNELKGLDWYSKNIQNQDKVKSINYNHKFKKSKYFIEIKKIDGIKYNYMMPLEFTKIAILNFINYYNRSWPKNKSCPCHGDLTLDNIIFSKRNISVIDWECFKNKDEIWGYDLLYLVLSATTFPYYQNGSIPIKDQKIILLIWKKLRGLKKIPKNYLNNPFVAFKKNYKKKHWKTIIRRSPKKFFPLIVNKSFIEHFNSIINKK